MLGMINKTTLPVWYMKNGIKFLFYFVVLSSEFHIFIHLLVSVFCCNEITISIVDFDLEWERVLNQQEHIGFMVVEASFFQGLFTSGGWSSEF